jgi:hypothetical protein
LVYIPNEHSGLPSLKVTASLKTIGSISCKSGLIGRFRRLVTLDLPWKNFAPTQQRSPEEGGVGVKLKLEQRPMRQTPASRLSISRPRDQTPSWHGDGDIEIHQYARSLQSAAKTLVRKLEADQSAGINWDAFQERLVRLYEQNAPLEETRRGVETYVRRWKQWVVSGLGETIGLFAAGDSGAL